MTYNKGGDFVAIMKKKIYLSTLILTFIYIILSLSITVINISANKGLLSGGMPGAKTMALMLSGIISSFMLIVAIMITVCSNANDWKASIGCQVFHLVQMLVGFVSTKSIRSLPGVLVIISGMCITILIRNYIMRLREDEVNLGKKAYTDLLTGLPNKRALQKKLNYLEAGNREFFLILLDINNFKEINDVFGHEKGDEILVFIADKWTALKTSENYQLYRIGGDRFAIIAETTNEIEAENLCGEAIVTLITEKNSLDAVISTSAGCVLYPKNTENISELLTYADTAMYKAKIAGKNQYRKFDSSMLTEIESQNNLSQEIKTALSKNKFHLVYQPVYYLGSHNLKGFEVLLRMEDAEGINISPEKFIKVAEKSSLIYEIDMWVIEHAIQETLPLFKEDTDFSLTINISGKHITTPGFGDKIINLLNRYPSFPKEKLVFDVTESSYVQDIETAKKALDKLKFIGCKIALDDFGTGYSSLKYLAKFPIDYLKIDKAFIDKMNEDDFFVRMIITLGHLFGFGIIAEGVERQDQISALNHFSCEFVQGFIWGYPIPVSGIKELLSSQEIERIDTFF